MTFRSSTLLATMPLLMLASPVFAQNLDETSSQTAPAKQKLDFEADDLNYDTDTEIVTATGNVRVSRGVDKLRADKVIWNRKTGEVRAEGNVIIQGADGDVAFGDGVTVNDSLREGIVENFLITLKDGGRLAARKGVRTGRVTKLTNAAFTPCPIEDSKGCPKEPTWKITAQDVRVDEDKNRVIYRNAELEMFGKKILPIPRFSHSINKYGATGLLLIEPSYTRTNGFELLVPYYWRFDRNRDLLVTPHIYTSVLPAIDAEYRALTKTGAYRVRGFLTYSKAIPTAVTGSAARDRLRGYFDSAGKFQLDPSLSIAGSVRLVTDRTILRRYEISTEDRLRSTLNLERITPNSYLSIAGWGFQTLRPNEDQRQLPFALPAIDFRQKMTDPVLGGQADLQLNSLALVRSGGQDTQRAFAGARWDLRKITPFGQEVTFTGYARGDVYHTSNSLLTSVIPYRGADGWNSRFIGAAAVEMRWPFVGPLLNGLQQFTPRVQIVASPTTENLKIPNEDARSFELEDSNLFALNRFPGYDRWEDGTRLTYGVDWGFDAPNLRVSTNIGQSYRFTSKPTLFPDGTGLSERFSDIVGRTTIKYKDLVTVTHRYRVDKDNFKIRRNEIDTTIGSSKTYVSVGYLKLNRDISQALEDLRDRQEIRAGGRVQIGKHWSIFGSAIIDLTSKKDDPLVNTTGFDPIRHSVGFLYEDDCWRFGLTWKRYYDTSGDAQRGNTFVFQLSYRNLGR